MVATAASVAVALAVLFVVLPSRGQHSASKTSQTIVSVVVTAPPVAAGSPAIAEDTNAPPEAVSTGLSEPQQPVQAATTRSAPARRLPAATLPDAAVAAILPDAEASAQPAVVDAASVETSTPALVQSAPYGKLNANSSSRLDFRVQGWFCHDASGGEIFVSAGAPLPGGVSC